MRIFHFLDRPAASPWYRAYVPGRELQRRGHEVAVDRSLGPEQVQWADVVVFHDAAQPAALQAADHARMIGKLTVYDLAQDIWDPRPSAPEKRWPREAVDHAEAIMSRCDMVTTTTAPLSRVMERLNPETVVVPDMLPDEFWPLTSRSVSDVMTLGWHDPAPNDADLRLVKELIARLVPQHLHFDFLLHGPEDLHIATTVSDDDLMIRSRMRIVPITNDVRDYVETLSRIDVGLVPLETNDAGRALTDSRLLEYAAVGAPCIATKLDAFSGTPALLAGNMKDWFRLVRRVLTEPGLREGAAQDALRWARTRVISTSKWEELFERGLSRRA